MAITRFLNRLRPKTPYHALPTPQDPVCIIGDVHGRADLLDRLLGQLAAKPDAGRMRVILVGDLIDRGAESLRVLRRVRQACATPAPFAEIICLMGNHERMMLDFLDDPVRHGPRWLANGGDATLESLGLAPHRRLPAATAEQTLADLHHATLTALPEGMRDWLHDLPLVWQEDRLVVTHAGADPAAPIAGQPAANHLWGHRNFRNQPREDGLWLAHGHFITRSPSAQNGRIAVDTGAWRTDCLTAAMLTADGLTFLSTTPAEAA